jgi:serine/threonine-protein phosphatase 4 regulatory subunit 1
MAQSLLDILREVCDDKRQCIVVLEKISQLADDSEPIVRAELMEVVPRIALFCQENQPFITNAFSKNLLPILVRYLTNQNNAVWEKVRKLYWLYWNRS